MIFSILKEHDLPTGAISCANAHTYEILTEILVGLLTTEN
jgi:hypothetical protein